MVLSSFSLFNYRHGCLNIYLDTLLKSVLLSLGFLASSKNSGTREKTKSSTVLLIILFEINLDTMLFSVDWSWVFRSLGGDAIGLSLGDLWLGLCTGDFQTGLWIGDLLLGLCRGEGMFLGLCLLSGDLPELIYSAF